MAQPPRLLAGDPALRRWPARLAGLVRAQGHVILSNSDNGAPPPGAPQGPWRGWGKAPPAPLGRRGITGTATPRPAAAHAIADAVRAGRQPRVRRRERRAAERGGFVLSAGARFGFVSAVGSTDDPRLRLITQHLPCDVAAELFAARDAGASEADQAAIPGAGLQDYDFRDRGRRPWGLAVEFTAIEWADFGVL
ncbi:telomere-protecting terminal protein Tpg [Kitasatospora sp. NPDC059571]|uniref:telomere-protecting terminal protein Tpg n=1 Tax=Kitasatospora sp. NPDC059571 TaxID=3346871 RepID=UPI00367D0285